MSEDICVKVWGSRGTCPVSGPEHARYGGNTSCVSVEFRGRMVVFDAGSGLSSLGKDLSTRGFKGRLDILVSHVHLDHIMGFFEFPPFFDADVEVHLYGLRRQGMGIGDWMSDFMKPPVWPVRFQDLPCRIYSHDIQNGQDFALGDGLGIRAMTARHPNGGLLYRLRLGEKSILYGLDCEMDETIWDRLVDFAEGCSLLISDAQYSPEECRGKKGWGHSSWKQGNALLKACGGGRVLHAHHAWDATDEELARRERQSLAEEPGSVYASDGKEVWI